MALSENERFLATGCDSGIVNLYDATKLRSGTSRTPQPLKCAKNLVTPVTTLEFNPSSEALLMASKYKQEAVKMVSRIQTRHLFEVRREKSFIKSLIEVRYLTRADN